MQNLLIFQIVVSLIVVSFIIRVVKKKREQLFSLTESGGWIILWLAILLFLWWPGALSLAAIWMGVGRGVDLAIYIALFLLFILIFRLFARSDRQQQEITALTRKIALMDADYDDQQ
jgi:hypothetical protein